MSRLSTGKRSTHTGTGRAAAEVRLTVCDEKWSTDNQKEGVKQMRANCLLRLLTREQRQATSATRRQSCVLSESHTRAAHSILHSHCLSKSNNNSLPALSLSLFRPWKQPPSPSRTTASPNVFRSSFVSVKAREGKRGKDTPASEEATHVSLLWQLSVEPPPPLLPAHTFHSD